VIIVINTKYFSLSVIISKYKYHKRLNVGLAVYTATDLGA